jgi:hypothetical protein
MLEMLTQSRRAYLFNEEERKILLFIPTLESDFFGKSNFGRAVFNLGKKPVAKAKNKTLVVSLKIWMRTFF